jgi:hypothetical protein
MSSEMISAYDRDIAGVNSSSITQNGDVSVQ